MKMEPLPTSIRAKFTFSLSILPKIVVDEVSNDSM